MLPATISATPSRLEVERGPVDGMTLLFSTKDTLDALAAILGDAVVLCRSQGWSWKDIGEALELGGETVKRRFGHPCG